MSFYVIDRELDFDVFNILKVGLITKAALDTNLNTKVISVALEIAYKHGIIKVLSVVVEVAL